MKMAKPLGQVLRIAIVILCAVCMILMLKSTHPSSYTSREDQEYLQTLTACYEQISSSSNAEVDAECRTFLQYVRDTVRNSSTAVTKASPQSISDMSNSTTGTLDCYSNLDVFSDRSHPFKNLTDMRINYLDSFRRCGKKPKLLSDSFEARTDNLSLPVPNVVHFIWSHQIAKKPREITFLQYMSVWSVNKYIKPTYILWHGEEEPSGYWWNRTVSEVPNIYYVHWDMPPGINGITFRLVQFQTDLLRLWILIVHGGMYFDTDLIILKPFEPLRQYPLVEGRELRFTVANGVILTAPWSLFLRMCLDIFRFFDNKAYVQTSMMLPSKISRLFPHYIHVEPRNILYPTWPHVKKLYMETFDWSSNYCVHIFGEEKYLRLLPKSIHDMDVSNMTISVILRHIYYNDTSLRPR